VIAGKWQAYCFLEGVGKRDEMAGRGQLHAFERQFSRPKDYSKVLSAPRSPSSFPANSLTDQEASFEVSGIGIHTGRAHLLRFKQGKPGSGLIFKVSDRRGVAWAPALWTRLSGTTRSTALVLRGPKFKVELRTIEHLMAALFVLGLVDVEIEVSCLSVSSQTDLLPEVFEIPVMDGSSQQWVEILKAKLKDKVLVSSSPQMALQLLKRVEVIDGDRKVVLEPWGEIQARTSFFVSVDFGHGLIQEVGFEMDWSQPLFARDRFEKSLAPARTFGFKHEVDELRARGLALGAQLENAILIENGLVVNKGGFRVPQELAAHKMVDAIGDFALLGAPLFARVELCRAGHSMHTRALQEAAEQGNLQEVKLGSSGLWTP
jgi:UDP-3-O-[3-hydroxymyristoyl] N-acetylglucosamine deacetylase